MQEGEEWREADICPLFKKGSRMEASSLANLDDLQGDGGDSTRRDNRSSQ